MRGADRFEELHDRTGRGLDGPLAVQGSDEEGPAAGADDEAIAALDAGHGDPRPEDEADEEILLPVETPARGGRRP